MKIEIVTEIVDLNESSGTLALCQFQAAYNYYYVRYESY